MLCDSRIYDIWIIITLKKEEPMKKPSIMTKAIRVLLLSVSELLLLCIGFLLWLIVGGSFFGIGLLFAFYLNLFVGVILTFWLKREVLQSIIIGVSATGLFTTGFAFGILILPNGYIPPWIRVCSFITLCLLMVLWNYMLRTVIKRFLSKPVTENGMVSLVGNGKITYSGSAVEEELIREVLYYIQEVKKLFAGKDDDFNDLLKDVLGMLFIIPVNIDHDYYRPNSDRLKISILLYETGWQLDSVNVAAKINKSDFPDLFHLTQEKNSTFYVRYTAGNFHRNYKSFMPILYDRIDEMYPGKFTLRDGLIRSNDTYGQRMF